jgi:hypothetical protein
LQSLQTPDLLLAQGNVVSQQQQICLLQQLLQLSQQTQQKQTVLQQHHQQQKQQQIILQQHQKEHEEQEEREQQKEEHQDQQELSEPELILTPLQHSLFDQNTPKTSNSSPQDFRSSDDESHKCAAAELSASTTVQHLPTLNGRLERDAAQTKKGADQLQQFQSQCMQESIAAAVAASHAQFDKVRRGLVDEIVQKIMQ